MLDPRDKIKGVGGEKQNVKHRHQKVYQRLPVDLFGEIKALLTRRGPTPEWGGGGGKLADGRRSITDYHLAKLAFNFHKYLYLYL